MIGRLSKLFTPTRNVFFASQQPFKPKPMPPKAPQMKPKAGQLSLSIVAQRLNITQETLRKQLLNPKTTYINPQELRILSIINGVDLSNNKSEVQLVLKKKSPVVTIMGHVDHGKTTLIDYLRKSKIAEGEIGGITQKIGAFHIECHGEKITFIDTPGHEAFSNMRKRGARVTDLIVLIVASTEGVKRQTQEVIDMINRDQIPTIVAISKIDLQSADVDMVETSLFEAGLKIEPKGGHIPVVHISAKTGQNVDLLSELILEETKDLKAIEEGQAEGIVLEATQSQGFNSMTLIVKQGTLKVGSLLIIGQSYAKVKTMHDDSGKVLTVARPGDAVQIIGIPSIPAAGDFIYEVQDENRARFITSKRKQKMQQEIQKEQSKNSVRTAKIRLDYRSRKRMYGTATNDAWISKFNEKQAEIIQKIATLRELVSTDPKFQQAILEKEEELQNHKAYVYQFLVNIGENKDNFNVILRFSDRGVEETIHEQLEPIIEKLKQKNSINVNILKSDIGDVTITDMEEAATCGAQIFTFGTELNHEAQLSQPELGVVPKIHKLIHGFLKDFEESAINRKKFSIKGTEKGRGVIAEIYKIKGKKATDETISVPGVRMTAGKLSKSSKIYIFRNGSPISDALFAKSIKVFKKEMADIKKGDECTITLDVKADFQYEKGDELVAYEQ